MNDLMNATETLLAHLVCADGDGVAFSIKGIGRGGLYEEVDAGLKLRIDPMFPQSSHTVQYISDGGAVDEDDARLYTTDPNLLLHPIQDLIGSRAEIALICGDRIKWTGYRKINNPPRGVWVASRGASLYEMHYREVFETGESTYFKRICAVSKDGKPVICLITGSSGSGSNKEGEQLTLAASVIEDASRPGVFTASIKDSAEIILPVPIGEHKELFALRDAPLAASGRRKAILHWVSKHIRRTQKSEPVEVAAHLRGVRQFVADGMTVTLSPNLTD